MKAMLDSWMDCAWKDGQGNPNHAGPCTTGNSWRERPLASPRPQVFPPPKRGSGLVGERDNFSTLATQQHSILGTIMIPYTWRTLIILRVRRHDEDWDENARGDVTRACLRSSRHTTIQEQLHMEEAASGRTNVSTERRSREP